MVDGILVVVGIIVTLRRIKGDIMPDAFEFIVRRIDINSYRIIVFNKADMIIRNQIIDTKEIMDKLGYELEQLKFRENVTK